jgi:hypothetical protein
MGEAGSTLESAIDTEEEVALGAAADVAGRPAAAAEG